MCFTRATLPAPEAFSSKNKIDEIRGNGGMEKFTDKLEPMIRAVLRVELQASTAHNSYKRKLFSIKSSSSWKSNNCYSF